MLSSCLLLLLNRSSGNNGRNTRSGQQILNVDAVDVHSVAALTLGAGLLGDGVVVAVEVLATKCLGIALVNFVDGVLLHSGSVVNSEGRARDINVRRKQ